MGGCQCSLFSCRFGCCYSGSFKFSTVNLSCTGGCQCSLFSCRLSSCYSSSFKFSTVNLSCTGGCYSGSFKLSILNLSSTGSCQCCLFSCRFGSCRPGNLQFSILNLSSTGSCQRSLLSCCLGNSLLICRPSRLRNLRHAVLVIQSINRHRCARSRIHRCRHGYASCSPPLLEVTHRRLVAGTSSQQACQQYSNHYVFHPLYPL